VIVVLGLESMRMPEFDAEVPEELEIVVLGLETR